MQLQNFRIEIWLLNKEENSESSVAIKNYLENTIIGKILKDQNLGASVIKY
jgi:hypothetical protein